MNSCEHQWMPLFFEIVYVGDGKNVNYMIKSVYCHGCGKRESIKEQPNE